MIKKCPFCNNTVGLDDNYCINCGVKLKDENVIIKQLSNSISSFYQFGLSLDSENFDNNKFPLVNYLKANHDNNIMGIFLDDFFNYLGYLGMADDVLHDNEVTFMNFILSSNFRKDEYNQMIKTALEEDPTESLPLTFVILHECDLNNYRPSDSSSDYTEDIFKVYYSLGKSFITIDNVFHTKEMEYFTKYMDKLKENLDQFKELGYKEILDTVKSNEPQEEVSTNDTTLKDELENLNSLVGLDLIKKDVNSLINLIQVRRVREQRGMKQPPMSLHLVFSGNPGTGKTTVARILSKIYYKMGLLSKGHLIETDRSGLVAGYVGHTAPKVKEVVQEAMGGILFIDEAYTLSSYKSENDFGQEAIDALLKEMEDHRDDLIVIVAGYPDLMKEFLQSNPGLQSRFNKFMYFEDYNANELYGIFKSMCDKNGLILEDKADEFVKTYFIDLYDNRGDNFGNGRDVRNLFESVLTKQADRIASNLNISDKELNTLTYEDFK